jgi:hypothetical protein
MYARSLARADGAVARLGRIRAAVAAGLGAPSCAAPSNPFGADGRRPFASGSFGLPRSRAPSGGGGLSKLEFAAALAHEAIAEQEEQQRPSTSAGPQQAEAGQDVPRRKRMGVRAHGSEFMHAHVS